MKDMRGEVCEWCGKDKYKETSLQDDVDGLLHCPVCKCTVKRWRVMNCNPGDKVEWVSKMDSGWLSVGRHYVGIVTTVTIDPASLYEMYDIDCEEGIQAVNIPQEWVIRIIEKGKDPISDYDRAMGIL